MKGVQGAIHFDVTGDETDLENALARSRASLIASGRTAEQEGAKIEQMFKRASSGVLAFFTVSKATDFVKSMATVHGEFQSIQIALSTIIGSEERANILFAQLKDTAAKTPFDMKSIAQGAKQLIAYGEDADTVNDTLVRLGNIAAGLSQPLGDLVYLYGTTMTQGRLYTQDLNQFTGRGIPMIRELADEFDVAESEVRGLVESGKVGFPEVQKVVERLTDKGGMFFDLMIKQSGSVIGKISNLEDAWASALDEMGQASEGFLYSGIEGATYLIEHYKTVLKVIGLLVTAYGSYKAALIVINTIQKSSALIENIRLIAMCRKELGLATAAQQAFNLSVKANPYVLAVSALLTVVSALALFTGNADDATETVNGLARANKKAGEEFDKEASKINALQGIVNNANVAYDKRKEALGKLIEIVPNYNAQLTKEGELVNDNTEAIKQYLTQLERQIKMKAAQEELEEAYRSKRKLEKELAVKNKELTDANSYNSLVATPAVNSKVSTPGMRAISSAGTKIPTESIKHDIDNLNESLSETSDVIDSLNKEIETTSVTTTTSTVKVKTFSEQVADAKTNVATLTQELKDLRAGKGDGITNWSKAIEDKEKELKTAQDSYNTMLGIKPDKKTGSTTSTEDYKTKIANESRELKRLYEDLEFSIQKARIDAMDEGLDKVLATNALNHSVELEAIKRQKEDALRKLRDHEKTIWESQNPDWKKKGLKFDDELYSDESLSKVKVQITEIGNQMNELFGSGNVDLLSRPLVDAAKLVEKGWEDAGEGIATVFSSQYDIEDNDGKNVKILVTPILPNGDVMSPDELADYVDNTLNGSEDVLKADDKGIVLTVGVNSENGEALHELQEQYYDLKETFSKPLEIEQQSEDIASESTKKLVINNKNALDDMLADFATYSQRRDKIEEDFDKKRKSMYNEDGATLKPGFTQGNVDELNRSEAEAYKAVDEQFAMREETYQAWMNTIANNTLDQLEMVLDKAEKELDELKKSGNADDKQLSVARAKVSTAKDKVSKAKAENDMSPGKRTIKEWQDLYKTLQDAEKEFESIGDTVGGVAGEIISTAGQMMTSTLSMISSIAQLANWSVISTQMTAQGASAAIQAVEKASVILTIISAAMQIAMTIINLFNNDKAYQKEIENLQERIDQLQWELDNEEAVRLGKSIDILNTVRKTYSEVTKEVLKLHSAEIMRGNFLYRMIAPITYQNEILQKSAEKLAVAYANIQYTADKALGSAKYDEAKEKLQNIAQQQLLMQEQIRNEDAKKKTDHGKIADWEKQIIELGEEANKIINEIVEDILGGSAADLAKELGDAFIDAFQAGEDAAEAWGDKVDDIVANVIKQMLVSKYLEEPLGAIFDKYKSKWYKDGEFAGIDAIMESMNGFANDLNGVGDEFKVIWDSLPDSIKNLLPVSDDDSREASERGIATASQESVDENNGRLTAIQGHTYSLNENVKTLVVIADKTLEAANAIRENTGHCKRLESIEKDIKSVKTKLDDFGDSGIKVK